VTSTREAADVFQAHRDQLGFVNEAQCREKDLYTAERDGKTVGAALGNHCVRKPQTTLYDLAVLPDYRREGVGVGLIQQLAIASPHDVIVAKCPIDLSAMNFYRATGWTLSDVETDRSRPLAVWELRL